VLHGKNDTGHSEGDKSAYNELFLHMVVL
jgi:hypothetical protein